MCVDGMGGDITGTANARRPRPILQLAFEEATTGDVKSFNQRRRMLGLATANSKTLQLVSQKASTNDGSCGRRQQKRCNGCRESYNQLWKSSNV